MTALKNDNGLSALRKMGLSDPWPSSVWSQYSGGVEVDFALVDGKRLLIARPQSWNYTLPKVKLDTGDTVETSLSKLREYLRSIGVSLSVGKAYVARLVENNGTLQVLIMVAVASVSLSTQAVFVETAPMMTGLLVFNLWTDLPNLLNW